MKRIIQSIMFCGLACAASAQEVQVVVPGHLAGVEGNSSASDPFNSTSFRFQQVFDASQFAIPEGAMGRIDGIAFRIDGASTEQVLFSFGGSTVTLSTTTRQPDGLSSVFVENRGMDSVTIWNGPVALGSMAVPGAMPQDWPFLGNFPVTEDFFYIPSQGNLLLDVAASGGQAFLPGALDAHALSGDSISWVFSTDGNSPVGTVQTLGLVTRFDITIIPEPSVWLLSLAGCAVMGVFKRR